MMPKKIPSKVQALLKKVKQQTLLPIYQPWQTIRDVISDLPQPYDQEQGLTITNHIFRQGARVYKGHTGSLLDEPAKTLKAGDHGVPGGENMFIDDIGNVRYFTVRESARLQGFPDNYYFPVSWSESMRQLGNAVPVPLAQSIAKSLSDCLHA